MELPFICKDFAKFKNSLLILDFFTNVLLIIFLSISIFEPKTLFQNSFSLILDSNKLQRLSLNLDLISLKGL